MKTRSEEILEGGLGDFKKAAKQEPDGTEEGLREDLDQLIRVCLTNPSDTVGFIAANYPKNYAKAIENNKGKTLPSHQPVELPLKAALRVLIREVQGVADDHHRPRYTRLDEALESAKTALAASDQEVAQASGITLEDAAKSEVDLQALFRAFVKSIQGTANWQLSQHHMPGQIVIPEEEIEYWLKYIPPHSSTVRESGEQARINYVIDAAISRLRSVDRDLQKDGWRIAENSTREKIKNTIKEIEHFRNKEQR